MFDGGVGNQLPILLIDFTIGRSLSQRGWESVTDPLDRLPSGSVVDFAKLGISYRSS